MILAYKNKQWDLFFFFGRHSPPSELETEVLKQNGMYGGSILPIASQNVLGMSEILLGLQLRSENAW